MSPWSLCILVYADWRIVRIDLVWYLVRYCFWDVGVVYGLCMVEYGLCRKNAAGMLDEQHRQRGCVADRDLT